jgi:hypothetical protein
MVSFFFSLELNNWKSRLPSQLDVTPATKAKSTPHRLMLHCDYWWCFILLHRPFFNRRAHSIQHSDREIDHVKVNPTSSQRFICSLESIQLCKRAAENILDLLETWSARYTLRYAPLTLLQIVFSAGTVFLLLALQATASLRIAHGSLKTALAQVEVCVRSLREMGVTWRTAVRTADILAAVLRDKLQPVIARRLAHKGTRDFQAATSSLSGSQDSASVLYDVDVGEPEETDFFLADLATSYPLDWNSQNQTTSQWSQTPLGFSTQSGSSVAGERAYPELDMTGLLLPNFGLIGAPELWEQTLLGSDTDRAREFYTPLSS